MDKNLLELIVVGILFLVTSRIAYLRARRRPKKDGGETDRPRPWAVREHVLTLVSVATMIIFLCLYIMLALREMLK